MNSVLITESSKSVMTWPAEVALIVAVLGFSAVILYVVAKRNRSTFDRASRMPLENDSDV